MSEPLLRIILLGPPGAGKGTQAVQLCKRYGLGHVSTGDILRRNTKRRTALGKKAAVFMKAGKLVPDDLIFDMLEDLYNRAGGEKQGFFLDGFPRSETQAQVLTDFLESHNEEIHKVLLLELADDVIVGRLVHRRTCPKCGRSYHLKSSPPKQEGLCDDDRTALVWRDDDHEDVIRQRLDTYHSQTTPVAEFYEKKGVLATIDASSSITEITGQICAILDELAPRIVR